jgi:heavy metal sensor kinase
MTLTTRLTMFFLGALAVLLAGFSITLYLLARTSWQHRIDDRLQACLNLMTAAVEKDGQGLEWEGKERLPFLEHDPDIGPVYWTVRDVRGHIVDHSRQGEGLLWQQQQARQLTDAENQQWATARGSVEIKEAKAEPLAPNPDGIERYPALIFEAALPLQPMHSALRQLAVTLAGVSLGLWLLAAVAGRWLCRRALMPVRHMACAARAMSAADRDQRLPVAATGDELHELGQAFNDLLARLQESFERQARFTGDASHQLRTPLTALLGQIEIALRHSRTADEYARVLSVLHGQALQLRQIIDSLLFLARADAEAKLSSLECLDLHAWLTEHLESWAGHARADDLQMQKTGAGPFEVRAQAPLLRQLLDNLLDNACKYSAAGTPITVSLRTEAETICLMVADTGCGIAEEDMPHLFEAFYRSSEARRRGVPGLGLGLAVAQRIAAALGGTLHVHSSPGNGAQFTLRMPMAAHSAAAPCYV